MLDCHRQNYIKGGRVQVVLVISPLFVSVGQYARAAFYYLSELRAGTIGDANFGRRRCIKCEILLRLNAIAKTYQKVIQ